MKFTLLNDLWWDVLASNEDISRFEDEFKTIANG